MGVVQNKIEIDRINNKINLKKLIEIDSSLLAPISGETNNYEYTGDLTKVPKLDLLKTYLINTTSETYSVSNNVTPYMLDLKQFIFLGFKYGVDISDPVIYVTIGFIYVDNVLTQLRVEFSSSLDVSGNFTIYEKI